jgi:trehalose 6-phosphate phosphatase
MRDILSPCGLRTLEEFTASNVLLGFDYDGTLAPLVEHPRLAYMRPSTRTLLEEAARLYPCAIVSGRARREVLAFLDGVQVLRVVGNHGVEIGRTIRAVPRDSVLRWRSAVEEQCAGISGLWIEDKTWSLAIHYRRAHTRSAARAAILAAAALLSDARVVLGKQVVNLVHAAAPNKGMAVLDVRAQLACSSVIYAGDDVTDEDVFALERPGQLLAIRVGRSSGSHASWCLRGQQQIDDVLATLIALRPVARRRAAAR